MKVMFQMMNEARIGVGLQALSSSSIAYLHALQYARERLQGSLLQDMKNPEAPRVPIICHPDVRRMLLWMKAHVDGIRALMYYLPYCADRLRIAADEAEKDKWQGMLEVMTPICKAYCSDMAFRVTETALQVYGGYGYCSEYPVEQFMRDIKIASLYEGANGIQALDLIGRKLGMKKGLYFINLLGEIFFLLRFRSVHLDEVGRPFRQIRIADDAEVMDEPLLCRRRDRMGKPLPSGFRGDAHGDPAAVTIKLIHPVKGFRHMNSAIFELAAFAVALGQHREKDLYGHPFGLPQNHVHHVLREIGISLGFEEFLHMQHFIKHKFLIPWINNQIGHMRSPCLSKRFHE